MSEQLPVTAAGKADHFALIKRAEQGDAAALAEVKRLAGEDLPLVWEEYGDLGRDLLRMLVERSAGKNHLRREALQETLAKMRADLAGPNPSPLERLLIERVLIAYMVLHRADLEALAAPKLPTASAAKTDFYEQRQERAERRYLAAIQALAKVRKLGVSVQVNIAAQGGQQVVLGS